MTFTFHHAAISVRNLEASMNFYGQLGFKEVHRYDAPDESVAIVHLALKDAMLELFCFSNAETSSAATTIEKDLPIVGLKHIALQVDSIRAAQESLSKSGLAQDPVIALGRTGIEYFFIQDPDGLWVEIVQDDRVLEVDSE